MKGQLTRALRALMAAVLVAFVAPAFAAQAEAQEYTLNFQTVAPDNTPWARQLQRLKKAWEAESGGRLKVKLFLGRGNENALARKCKSGEIQAIGVSTAAIASEVPEMGVFELPYLFKSPEEADALIDNHLFDPVSALLAENNYTLYIFSENGFRNFATKGKAIHTSEDLAALKMRSQENWIHEETYRALGGNPVRIAVPEVLTSLSTGQVGGFDNTPLFAFATSWFSEIDTWTVSDHIYQPAVVVFNKKWFDSLPADIQQILTKERAAETAAGRKAVRELTPKLMGALEKKGITIVQMTQAEKDAFAKRSKPVHAKFREKVGSKGAKLLDTIEKNRKK